jgi:hypothetical protein
MSKSLKTVILGRKTTPDKSKEFFDVNQIIREMERTGVIDRKRIPRKFAATMRKMKLGEKKKISAAG